jgi:hypothetical protein
MVSKKDRRSRGRKEGRLLGKNSGDIEEEIEPTFYWDEWVARDGFRNGNDRTHLYKGVPLCFDKEKIEKINNKIKKELIIKMKQRESIKRTR